jgi:hypothetical protein
MSEHAFPPQLLQGDPIALYGRPDEPGNGPLVLSQKSPAAGDVLVRGTDGYWHNVPGVSYSGSAYEPATSKPTITTAEPIKDATGVWSTWYVPMAASTKLTIEFGPTEAEVNKVKLEAETAASSKQIATFRLPPNWWVKLTSASLGQPVVVTG